MVHWRSFSLAWSSDPGWIHLKLQLKLVTRNKRKQGNENQTHACMKLYGIFFPLVVIIAHCENQLHMNKRIKKRICILYWENLVWFICIFYFSENIKCLNIGISCFLCQDCYVTLEKLWFIKAVGKYQSLNVLQRHPVKKTQSVHISLHIVDSVAVCGWIISLYCVAFGLSQ